MVAMNVGDHEEWKRTWSKAKKCYCGKKWVGKDWWQHWEWEELCCHSKHALVVPMSEHQESHLLPGDCPCHSPASPGTGKHEAWHCTPPCLLFRIEKEKSSNGNAENKLALNTGILRSYISVCRYCMVYWDGKNVLFSTDVSIFSSDLLLKTHPKNVLVISYLNA